MYSTTSQHVQHHQPAYTAPPASIYSTTSQHVQHHQPACTAPPASMYSTTSQHVQHHQPACTAPTITLLSYISTLPLNINVLRSNKRTCTCLNRLQHISTSFNIFQQASTYFNKLQHISTSFNMFQQPSTCFNNLQQVSTTFNMFQQPSFIYLAGTGGCNRGWIFLLSVKSPTNEKVFDKIELSLQIHVAAMYLILTLNQ